MFWSSVNGRLISYPFCCGKNLHRYIVYKVEKCHPSVVYIDLHYYTLQFFLDPVLTIPDSSCITFLTESDIKILHVHTI